MTRTILIIASILLILAALPLMSACAEPAPAPAPAPGPPPGPPPAPEPTPTMLLRVVASVPAQDKTAQTTELWGKLVTERTNGRVTFEYLWGGSLTKRGEELDAISSGIANAGHCPIPYFPDKLVLNNASYAVPFNTPDITQMKEALDKLIARAPELATEFEDFNMKLIFYPIFGSYEMLSVRPVSTLADFKGLKVACIGSTLPKMFEAVDAAPVAMGVADRYSALQTGIIEAEVLSIPITEAFKYTDICKHCSLVNMGTHWSANSIVMNLDDWKKLSPEEQKIVMEAGEEAAQWHADSSIEDESGILKLWEERGVKFYQLSDADRKEWAQRVSFMPYEWAKEWDAKGYPATKVLEAFLKATDEVGYKYPVEWTK